MSGRILSGVMQVGMTETNMEKDQFKLLKQIEKDNRKYRISWFWFYLWGAAYIYILSRKDFVWMAIFGAMYFFVAMEYNFHRPVKKKALHK